jgi:MFS family permease
LALTSLGFFMVGLDALVVVTALPAIHRDLGASLDSLQWTVNAYSLAWASSSLGSPTAFIAGFRPSFTMIAGLAVLGGLAAFGVGNAQTVAPASSSPELGAAPAS